MHRRPRTPAGCDKQERSRGPGSTAHHSASLCAAPRPGHGLHLRVINSLMNLHALLLEREAQGRPVTVGLIGAGKFGTMFLAQARLTRGLHVVGVADLNIDRARSQLAAAGWPAQQYAATSLGEAATSRSTHVTPDAAAMIAHPG